jgi:hypothetical protein
MRQFAAIFTTFFIATAGVPVFAQGASASGPQPADTNCVALKEGNPRISNSIGIVFGSDVPRELVETAVEHWSKCHGYRTDFPAFVIGEPGTQTVQVKFDNSYQNQPRCGSFVGRTIVLYAFATDRKGRVRSCGSRVD